VIGAGSGGTIRGGSTRRRPFPWFISLTTTLLLGFTLLSGDASSPALPEYTGKDPVVEAHYEGVDRLLVLSDRWVIVVTSTTEELIDAMDELTHGQYKRAISAWDRTKRAEKKDWTMRKVMQDLRTEHIAQAREAVGERELLLPDAYRIESLADDRYNGPQAPKQVAYIPVGLGGERITGGPYVDYGHYSYIELPHPLRRGVEYTITVQGKKTVRFTFDERHSVSRAIKVNQVGYLPDAPHKYAYLGAHLYSAGPMDFSAYKTFEVVDNATGEVVFTGPITPHDQNSWTVPHKGSDQAPIMLHGENVFELDFSALKATGTFYIRIAGVGRSWPFKHGPSAYGEAFYTSARGFYHQRCGIACEAPYTAWKRQRCHTDPVYESEHIEFPRGEVNRPKNYERFDVIGATTDTTRKTDDARGGWHDAADWDRAGTHYAGVFDFLYAYELAPAKFRDGQLNLPESGNGVPDVLDEAHYGLEVWRKSMRADGGVSGAVETWTHPPLNGDVDYAYAQRTRWDSLLFAAAAAQLAQHLKAFDEKTSAVYEEAAIKAWGFGNNPANSLGKTTIHAKRNRGKGETYTIEWEEKDAYVVPYLLHAGIRLFLLTGDKQYLGSIPQALKSSFRPYVWPCTLTDYSPWVYFSLAHESEGILPDFQRRRLMKTYFLDPADELVRFAETMPYRFSWPRNKSYGLVWGESVMSNPGRALLIAHALTGNEKYRDTALQNLDFMLGANPMGMSWTTGMGYTYPTDIQHGVSQYDGIADPVPGTTIYSITSGIYPHLRNEVWRSPGGAASAAPVIFQVPVVPLWRSWSCHPDVNTVECEFTIHETMSSMFFCTAMMIPDGWKPDEALLNREPRNEQDLHGRWYLP